jgi:hypothetical protein
MINDDGKINYSNYECSELEYCLENINGERYPKNLANLISEIENRKHTGKSIATKLPFQIKKGLYWKKVMHFFIWVGTPSFILAIFDGLLSMFSTEYAESSFRIFFGFIYIFSAIGIYFAILNRKLHLNTIRKKRYDKKATGLRQHNK